MKHLKKLGAAIVLTCALGLTAFAGETMTPPCAPPEPGQTSTPPCATAQAPNTGEIPTPPAVAPGQTDTPPMGELSLTEIASSVLLRIVSLF